MRIEFARMPVVSNPIPEAVFFFVVLSWIAFMLVFFIWRKPAKAKETKRDNASRWGMLLQSFAFFVTWLIARQYFTPIVPMPKALEFVVAVLTIALAASSVWICATASRTLGHRNDKCSIVFMICLVSIR